MKKCTKCGQLKSDDEFYTYQKGVNRYRMSRCKACLKIIRADKYRANMSEERLRARERSVAHRSRPDYRSRANRNCRLYNARLRRDVIKLLGGTCKICGDNDQRVLQVDHIDGGGARERQTHSMTQLYRKILSDATGYQLLCANCNWRKRDDSKRSSKVSCLRSEALAKFGGLCVSCSCEDEEVLQFDHINGDGCIARKSRDMSRRYRQYIAGKHIIQLLCANCHQIKTCS